MPRPARPGGPVIRQQTETELPVSYGRVDLSQLVSWTREETRSLP
jgi:hypothetical protein